MSEQMTLDKKDWKAIGKSALVWSAPVLLIYVTAVMGVLQTEGHVFSFRDFIPSTFTQGGIATWFISQVQGALIRLTRGQ
jgi:hypothetical protein